MICPHCQKENCVDPLCLAKETFRNEMIDQEAEMYELREINEELYERREPDCD